MNKQELRRVVKAVRKGYTEKKFKDLSENICKNLFNSKLYYDAKTILCYKAKSGEINTDIIIKSALSHGKRVGLPVCVGNEMHFFEIKKNSKLILSKMGILEPDTKKCKKILDFEDTLCVIPCLCADRYGHRLGYGGGFYDRFLKDFEGTKAVLCPKELVYSKIPYESYDISADYIISE